VYHSLLRVSLGGLFMWSDEVPTAPYMRIPDLFASTIGTRYFIG
jgi:hypothetical protein